MKARIYLSGPLFSAAEISWGKWIKTYLEEALDVEIFWPQEAAGSSPQEIFQANLYAMKECDFMVANIDGPQVDDGTAWEIGYFYAQNQKIIGIRTDFRRAGEFSQSRINAMIECSCLVIVNSLDQLASELKRFLN